MAHIIITGSSRGIGLAIAKQAAQEGHRVLALSRNAETVRSLGLDNLEALPFDITNPQSLEEADAWIDKNWGGKIDILINNAGVLTHKPLAQTTLEDFQSVYAVNVFGPALLMGLWAPKMGKQGHVVNISSMGGIQGSAKFAGLSAYSSSKGALITLTELLAEEYKETGPHFNALALGAVDTEMLQQAFPGYQAQTSADEMAAYVLNFALNSGSLLNGKVVQVSNSTP